MIFEHKFQLKFALSLIVLHNGSYIFDADFVPILLFPCVSKPSFSHLIGHFLEAVDIYKMKKD